MSTLHERLLARVTTDVRSAVADLYNVHPVDSVRFDWHEVTCAGARWSCEWSTTGSEPVCDDAGYEHVMDNHGTEEALGGLRGLRAVVVRHKPVPCSMPECGDPEHQLCAGCGHAISWPEGCPDTMAIAEALGVETGETP